MIDFKIFAKGETYGKAVLIERNINIAEIGSEEFAEMLYSDIKEAEEFYKNMNNPVLEAEHIEKIKAEREAGLKRAISYANIKWKTEKRRNQHIEEYKARMSRPIEIPYWVRESLRFFDYKIDPWANFVEASFKIDTVTKEEIARVHQRTLDSEWVQNAIGYRLVYDTQLGYSTYTCSSRPQIELIFDEEWTAKWEAGRKGLSEAISNFYANTVYFGD